METEISGIQEFALKTALIIGVSGQDGSYLARSLLNKGYNVYGTSRDAETASFKNLIHLGIRGSVKVESATACDFRSIFQCLDRTRPDEVYNLAGQSSVRLSFQQPVETFESISIATLNILEAIRFSSLPIRFYNACSSECFGDTIAPASETNPFHPKSPYAVAKAAAFWEVANYRDAYGLFACSGILFNHESPLRPERFVTKKIVSTAYRISKGSRETLRLGDIGIERDWGWAPEYVEAMWHMLQQDQPDDFVIATGESHTLEEFVTLTFHELGLDWQDHVLIDEILFRPNELKVGRAIPTKAAEKLGWSARYKLKEVIQAMLQAEIQNTL